jgi:hypothetical protein
VSHQQARLLIGGDPHAVPPELAEHLASCPECTQFQREMVALDGNIRRALEQRPAGAAAPVMPTANVIPIMGARARRNKQTTSWPGWALAASVVFAAFATLAIWGLRPTDTLAHDVVMHVEGEPKSWAAAGQISPDRLNGIMRKAGVWLDARSEKVTYAQSCRFRGHDVPHLVVSTSRGPVTVLVLRHEKVKARESFHEDGMSGVITPAPHGSIAVLAQGNENIDEVAGQVQQALRWLPDSH